MKHLQNLHTHSTYCDGNNTLEEMIQTCIEKGFTSLGFSGHSYMYFADHISMSLEGTEAYKQEILQLKEKYKDTFPIFLGLEFEMFSEIDLSGYDYLIGSTHYMNFNGEKVGFDRSADEVRRVINTYYGGDGMKYARDFYANLSRLPEYGDFDIIAHFDLITKHSEKENFFDTTSNEYREYALAAVEALAGKIPYFEVNTGAMARGYRTTPYPDPFILRELKRQGFKPIISSDCHQRNMVDFGFSKAAQMLKDNGFTEHYVLTDKGFIAVPLEDYINLK